MFHFQTFIQAGQPKTYKRYSCENIEEADWTDIGGKNWKDKCGHGMSCNTRTQPICDILIQINRNMLSKKS